jgi:excisionase family DNA binding protein
MVEPRLRVVAGQGLTASAPAVLTVDELAVLLRVERKTAYAAVARGEVPGVRRVGRCIRISRDAVLKWLAQGERPQAGWRRTAA